MFYKATGHFLYKGTIQPGLRLVPSGNFFLALNRSHHFLLKKSQNLIRQLEHNDSTLIILHCWKYWEYIVKLSSLNHCAEVKFWLFFNKKWRLLFKAKKKFADGRSLGPGWLVPLEESLYLKVEIRLFAFRLDYHHPRNFNVNWNSNLSSSAFC